MTKLWNQARAAHNRKTPTDRPMSKTVMGDEANCDQFRELTCPCGCGYHVHIERGALKEE